MLLEIILIIYTIILFILTYFYLNVNQIETKPIIDFALVHPASL
jgi:hypothetical protein